MATDDKKTSPAPKNGAVEKKRRLRGSPDRPTIHEWVLAAANFSEIVGRKGIQKRKFFQRRASPMALSR